MAPGHAEIICAGCRERPRISDRRATASGGEPPQEFPAIARIATGALLSEVRDACPAPCSRGRSQRIHIDVRCTLGERSHHARERRWAQRR
jgi:hypothetical protein